MSVLGDSPDGQFRQCRDCGEVKPLTEFHASPRRAGGRGSYCKPCHNARGRESKQRLFGGSREYHLRRRYGIGQADFDRMLAQQGGICPICDRPNPDHVDHDHATGELRGILCFNCNQGLGNFRDSPQAMARAIEYLSRYTPPWNEIGPQVSLVRLPRQRSDEPVGSRS